MGFNIFPEKMGISRVLEALESNDWDAVDDDGPLDLDSDAGDLESSSGLPRKPRPLAGGGGDDDDDFDFDLDPESLDFGFDKSDFEGLKKAIWNLEQDPEREVDGSDGGSKTEPGSAIDGKEKVAERGEKEEEEKEGKEDLDSEEVEKIERMMRKLQAVRDMSAGLPEEQRRRMAKKAVGEVMKEL